MRKYTHLGRVVRCEEYVETDVDRQAKMKIRLDRKMTSSSIHKVNLSCGQVKLTNVV